MSEAISESSPLRAFVRGAWILLLVQLAVALLVFGALSYASVQLNRILGETAVMQDNLKNLRTERKSLQQSIDQLKQSLQNAHDATPIVRSAINSFHNRRYAEAVDQYQEALRLDPDNHWVRDLMSYSQYMAGRAALTAGQVETSARRFEDAVASVRQVLREVPDYIGGHVELAIYECARDQPDAALAAYDAALARSQDAKEAFASRLGEIPQRCAALRSRLRAQ